MGLIRSTLLYRRVDPYEPVSIIHMTRTSTKMTFATMHGYEQLTITGENN